jgi:beta-1,4-mannosyl-glycoprotein beta-1,4-N-acetylglucosaminyltransferase
MLIDAFTFFNEYDMLESRLEYLNKTVDYFIIVECDHTHAGNPKELNFPKEISRYRDYLHKIMYLPLSIDPKKYDFTKPKGTDYSAGQWILEKQQRNYMVNGLKFFHPDSFVLISDVDEVPTVQSIEKAKDVITKNTLAVSSEQEMFWYNFKQKETKLWSGTVMTRIRDAMQNSPEFFRVQRWSLPKVLGGYHMTYFMEVDKMKYKIENFAHQELNQTEYTDVQKIQERIENGIEPFARIQVPLVSVKPESIDSEIYRIFGKVPKT